MPNVKTDYVDYALKPVGSGNPKSLRKFETYNATTGALENTIYMKDVTDYATVGSNILASDLNAIGNAVNNTYPVGAIYLSVNSTSPASLFGGTWEQIKDRVLIGAGNLYAVGDTGGEATHILTVDEMPSHKHIMNPRGYVGHFSSGSGYTTAVIDNYTEKGDVVTSSTGGSQPHNNMPPYLAVYMWKRIA